MEIQAHKSGNRKKRTIIAMLAVLCALALLLMGTFAYYSMVNAVNEFGSDNDNSAVLHDDYDEDYDDSEEEYDKDIYVENDGSVDLFIRVTLEEYLELDGTYKLPAFAVYDEDQGIYIGWHRHAYSTTEAGYVCTDCGKSFHAYFAWEMGSESIQVYKKADLEDKIAGTAYRYRRDELTGAMEDTWQTTAGSGGIPGPGSSYDDEVWDEIPACEVITMAEYWQEVEKFEQDAQEGINPAEWKGWILDSDGWAYWSQQLCSGETTGLLLSKVTKRENPPAEAYFYGIHAVLDAADGLDVAAWLDEDTTTIDGESPDVATEEAIRLLKAIGAE